MRKALLPLAVSALVLPPSQAHAQWVDAGFGTVLGASGGALVSAAWITVDARLGNYLFDVEDATWQLLPIPLGAALGGLLGHRNSARLWDGVEAGVIGLAAGAGAGALVGRLVWDTPDGAWAGAVIGGATGVVVGMAIGTLAWERAAEPRPLFTISIPVGR